MRSSVSNGSCTRHNRMLALILDKFSLHNPDTARAAATALLHG